MPLSTDEKIALGVAAAIGGSVAVFLIGKQLLPTVFSVQQQPVQKPVTRAANGDGSGFGLNWFSEDPTSRGPDVPVLV